MIRLVIVILVVNLGLFACSSAPQRNESATNDTKASNPGPETQANSNKPSNWEPSIEQLQKAVPPELLKQSDCAIEEDVAMKPESGHGQAPLKVTFDAGASKSICGKMIVGWVWDFGDGAKAKGPRVRHTYITPGTYVATVSMTDNRGYKNLARLEHTVTVIEARSSQHNGNSSNLLKQGTRR